MNSSSVRHGVAFLFLFFSFCALEIYWLSAEEENEELTGIENDRIDNSASRAVKIPPITRIPDNPIDRVKSESGGLLVIRDELTDKPLVQVELCLIVGKSKVPIGKTNDQGEISLSRQFAVASNHSEYVLLLSKKYGGGVVSCSGLKTHTVDTWKMHFPVYGELLIHAKRDATSQKVYRPNEVAFWVVTWPPPNSLLKEGVVPPNGMGTIKSLYELRDWPAPTFKDPPFPTYHQYTREFAKDKASIETASLMHIKAEFNDEGVAVAQVPYTGPLFIDCLFAKRSRIVQPAEILRGTRVAVNVIAKDVSSVRGRVIDIDGNPMADVQVGVGTIRISSNDSPNDVNAAMTFVSPDGKVKKSLYGAMVRTDKRGFFDVQFPTRGEIHAYVAHGDFELSEFYSSFDDCRERDWQNDPLILTLKRRPANSKVMVFKSGVPLSNVKLVVSESQPKSLFQAQYPPIVLGSKGTADFSNLVPGRRYFVISPKLRTASGVGDFVFEPGQKLFLFER